MAKQSVLRYKGDDMYLANPIAGSPAWLVRQIVADDASPTGFWTKGEPQFIVAPNGEDAIKAAA